MRRFFLWVIVSLLAASIVHASDNPLDKIIRLDKFRGTTYEALNVISHTSGMLFIYDSKVIDNERRIKLNAGEMTLRRAIALATNTPNVGMRVIGRHILLYPTEAAIPDSDNPLSSTLPALQPFIVAEGIVYDSENREPLSLSSVSLEGSSISSVANRNGYFQLKIPDSLQNAALRISHLGYKSQLVPAALLALPDSKANIYLEASSSSLQEVIIRLVNPEKIVRDMLTKRAKNYANQSVYLTVFYRENITQRKEVKNLTEGVFKTYAPPFYAEEADQAKLLKMRKIDSQKKNDTLVVKLKAGVNSALSLNLIKDLPDFLLMDADNPYHYSKIDMTEIDGRPAHVIAFEQRKGFGEALYRGLLYVDAENAALLQTDFEIAPQSVRKMKNMFVVRQSRHIKAMPKQIKYHVSYKDWSGKYYLNYVRGEINFEVTRKRLIFNRTTDVSAYFEMAVCKIDTTDVKRFPHKESIATKSVFSETNFSYDPLFWANFNVIPLEEWLNKSIEKISAKIEESEEE